MGIYLNLIGRSIVVSYRRNIKLSIILQNYFHEANKFTSSQVFQLRNQHTQVCFHICMFWFTLCAIGLLCIIIEGYFFLKKIED